MYKCCAVHENQNQNCLLVICSKTIILQETWKAKLLFLREYIKVYELLVAIETVSTGVSHLIILYNWKNYFVESEAFSQPVSLYSLCALQSFVPLVTNRTTSTCTVSRYLLFPSVLLSQIMFAYQLLQLCTARTAWSDSVIRSETS